MSVHAHTTEALGRGRVALALARRVYETFRASLDETGWKAREEIDRIIAEEARGNPARSGALR